MMTKEQYFKMLEELEQMLEEYNKKYPNEGNELNFNSFGMGSGGVYKLLKEANGRRIIGKPRPRSCDLYDISFVD